MRRRQAPAPLGAPPLQNQATALRGHACAKSVRLGPPTIVWLECSFRHNCLDFLLQTKVLRLAFNVFHVKERAGLYRPLLSADLVLLLPKYKKTVVPKPFINLSMLRKIRDFGKGGNSKIPLLKKHAEPCGILLHLGSGYASLAPVSQGAIARK